MAYYRDSVTEASWQLLQKLKREYKFCLIGGWAVWLYTKQLKSKDIDLVVAPEELSRIREKYALVKNDRLKKYEFRQGEVQIDVYSAYYSDLGLAAELILDNQIIKEGFKIPAIELLIVLKLVAWIGRRGSGKGRKDLIDIVSLVDLGECQKEKLTRWLKKTGMENAGKELIKAIKQLSTMEELGLNQHQIARRKKVWLERLENGKI
ncbi:MAG: hypothetical protein AAB430_02830 [Patescibacteria group bacterium]